MDVWARKPMAKVTTISEGFEIMTEAMEAKKRMMLAWQEEGLGYPAAVLRYADEQKVPTTTAAERLNDLEVLTGVRLERV